MPGNLYEAQIDHVYEEAVRYFCDALRVPTLGQLLSAGNGRIFCSTEQFQPCPDVYDKPRVASAITPPGNAELSIVLEYSTVHVRSDTLRMDLHRGQSLAAVAVFDRKENGTLYFRPLVMGWPWLSHSDEHLASEAMWVRYQHFENFVVDFNEFARVRNLPVPPTYEPMKEISEAAFKACLAKLLGDTPRPDWGGETSDHFAAHLHLNDRPVTGAFLLKGPSRFAPMDLNHLGKNNDQIYRLAQEPADVLFVQHCHEIMPPVRATLRAFAYQPGRPRRYCFMDGKESLRLLQAYGLYEEALRLSASPHHPTP